MLIRLLWEFMVIKFHDGHMLEKIFIDNFSNCLICVHIGVKYRRFDFIEPHMILSSYKLLLNKGIKVFWIFYLIDDCLIVTVIQIELKLHFKNFIGEKVTDFFPFWKIYQKLVFVDLHIIMILYFELFDSCLINFHEYFQKLVAGKC